MMRRLVVRVMRRAAPLAVIGAAACGDGSLTEPGDAPLATRIVFQSDRDADSELYALELDLAPLTGAETPTGEAATLRLTSTPGTDEFPHVGRNGRIAFDSERDGNFDIFVMDADGGRPMRLTTDTAADVQPVWSPDGGRLAFASGRHGNLDIFTMRGDGTGLVRLTDDPAVDLHPSWSPDGAWLAFETTRTGQSEIFVMRAASGTDLRNLTMDPQDDVEPAWSPDGLHIAFTRLEGDPDEGLLDAEVYIVALDGTVVNLTDHPSRDTSPAWSPDGRSILFTSVRGGNPDLWVIDADGGDPVNITRSAAGDHHGVWSP